MGTCDRPRVSWSAPNCGACLATKLGFAKLTSSWTKPRNTPPYDLTVSETVVESGPGTAIIVNVAASAAEDAISWITANEVPVSKILTVTPSRGVGPKSVPTAEAANGLAVAIRNLARPHAPAGLLHLFLIGPLGLAVLLGHHWNRLTTTHVYEHLGGREYTSAFVVHA